MSDYPCELCDMPHDDCDCPGGPWHDIDAGIRHLKLEHQRLFDEIKQLRTELDKVTRWCAGLMWAADQVDEPTIGEIRAYVDRCVTKGDSDE